MLFSIDAAAIVTGPTPSTPVQPPPSIVDNTFSGQCASGERRWENSISNPQLAIDVKAWCKGLKGSGWNWDPATSNREGSCSMICHCAVPHYARTGSGGFEISDPISE